MPFLLPCATLIMSIKRKKIPLEKLSIGMCVVGMDRSWIETPFLRHRVQITGAEQIEKLKGAGVRFVEVECDERDAPAPEPVSMVHASGSLPPEPAVTTAPAETPATSFDEELPISHQVYCQAKEIVHETMQNVKVGRAIDTEQVGSVVRGMVDSILRNPDALVSLSRLKSFDEYTFFHSVNTSVLAVALGRRLQLSRDALHLLGTGILLHDIGKTKIPLEILNKPGRFEPHEFEIMKQHALRGVEVLSSTSGFQDEVIRPALEHHERVDGTGYPYGRGRQELTQFGLISSVVDIYDAMTSDRCYHKAIPPHRALQHLYGLAQDGHLDMKLVQQFIQCIGVYPVGSCVLLSTGEVGVVQQLDHDQPITPKVILVRDANLQAIPPKPLNLRDQGSPHRKIIGVMDSQELAIDVAQYLAVGVA